MPEPPQKKLTLDDAIAEAYAQMQAVTADDPIYGKMADNVAKLEKLRYETTSKPERLSKDTIAVIAGNVAITLVIVAYEQRNAVTTKALNFLTKLR